MSKYIFDLKTDVYAIVDTSRGTVFFSKAIEHVTEKEITIDQKKAILNYYIKQFKKNKKLVVYMKDKVSSDYYDEYANTIRNEIENKINIDEIHIIDVHLDESADLNFFTFFLKNNFMGENGKDGCVYCDPFQNNIFEIIGTIKKVNFWHICFVLNVEDCLKEKAFQQFINVINEATQLGLIIIVLLNVSDDSLDKLKEVYYKLFKEGAYRTKINEIWVNSAYKDYNYKNSPFDLMLETNIQCYEEVMKLVGENPEMMTMRIVGNNYIKRIQNVFEERVPLRPIQAYDMKDLIQVKIQNNQCVCNVHFNKIEKCQNCEKFELCGGLYDKNNRCIDFNGVITSVYEMYKFVKGENK